MTRIRYIAYFLFAAAVLCAQSEEQVRQSQHARQLMAQGRFTEAIPIYQGLVNALPGNPGLLLNLGLAEHMAGQDRLAIPHFEAVLKAQSGNIPALFSLGAARLALGDPRAAVEPLRQVVAAQPTNPDARGMLAGALFAIDRFSESAEQYRTLAKLTPADPRVWFGLGRSYEALSSGAFRQLAASAPQSGFMAALLADSRSHRRLFRSAYFFYHQALDRVPNLPGTHAGLAEVYRRTDHANWAAEEEKREKRVPPPDCAHDRPVCEFLAGRYLQAALTAHASRAPAALFWQSKAYNELALGSYQQLGKLPESAQIHQVKANILDSQGQALEAAREWREAIRLEPGNSQYRRQLANSLYMAQDYKSALPMLQKFLQADPSSSSLNLLVGDSLLHLDDVDKSIPFLEKAVHADPKLLQTHASLGLAYSRLGRAKEAIPQLEAALALDADGSLHYQLARAYQSAGDAAKARATMSEYQEIQKKLQAGKDELAKEAQIGPPS
jgi:tetratricopeptide (TPR) repeat protein